MRPVFLAALPILFLESALLLGNDDVDGYENVS